MSWRGAVRMSVVAVDPDPGRGARDAGPDGGPDGVPEGVLDAELLLLSFPPVPGGAGGAAGGGGEVGVRLARELEQIAAAESVLLAAKVQRVARLARLRARQEDRTADPTGTDIDTESDAGSGWDGPDGVDGCGRPRAEVGEFVPDEVALIERCSRAAATTLIEQSLTLVEHLPEVLGLLRAGRLDKRRALALGSELAAPAREADPGVVAAVAAAVLPAAMELGVQQLRRAVRAELVARDPAAAERRARRARRPLPGRVADPAGRRAGPAARVAGGGRGGGGPRPHRRLGHRRRARR